MKSDAFESLFAFAGWQLMWDEFWLLLQFVETMARRSLRTSPPHCHGTKRSITRAMFNSSGEFVSP